MRGFIVFLCVTFVASSAEGTPPPTCPPPGEGNVVLFPNPDNCATFYICNGLDPVLTWCDPPLWFNPSLKVCDYPENIPDGVCVPPGGSSSEAPTSTAGTTIPDTTTSSGSTPPTCPPPGEGDAVLFPNPDNCATFYVCEGLDPILTWCIPPLWFNPNLKVCDYPENIPEGVCVPPGGSTSNSPSSSVNPTSTVAPTTTEGTTIPDTTTSAGTTPPTCPPPSGGDAVLFPNPDNCATFYVCDGLDPILTWCIPPLWFNPSLKVCDYPENIPEGVCVPP